jgi:hypothetical protein
MNANLLRCMVCCWPEATGLIFTADRRFQGVAELSRTTPTADSGAFDPNRKFRLARTQHEQHSPKQQCSEEVTLKRETPAAIIFSSDFDVLDCSDEPEHY